MMQKKVIEHILIILLLLLPISMPGYAGSLSDTFIDPGDGYLDMSKWLLDKKGPSLC